jgi:hypothetical protein
MKLKDGLYIKKCIIVKNMRKFRILLFVLSFSFISCGNSNGSAHNDGDSSSENTEVVVSKTKPMSFYKGLLEEFCKVNYHDMFEGRSYIFTSIHIDECKNVAAGIVDITGTHSYEGRFGKRYDGYQFKANIREMANEPDTYYIIFEKEGVKPITQRKFWESSSRTFVYKE